MRSKIRPDGREDGSANGTPEVPSRARTLTVAVAAASRGVRMARRHRCWHRAQSRAASSPVTIEQEQSVSDIDDIADRTAAGIALRLPVRRGHARRGDRMPARPHREGPRDDNVFITVTADRALARSRACRSALPAATRRCRRSTACRSAGRIFSTSPARRPRPARDCSRGEPAKTADLACRRQCGGSRHGDDRQAQHDRVRLFGHRPQPALRHAAQSERPGDAALAGRLVVGLRRGGGGAAGAVRGRFRHRRLGAHSGRL